MSQAVIPPAVSARSDSHTIVRLLLVLLLSAGTFFAVPASARAQTEAPAAEEASESSTDVSWSVGPADTAQGKNRPNFSYESAAGSEVNDAILVTNRGDVPLELDVYAADGFLTPDGSLDILAAGEPSTELGSWVSVTSTHVSLAGGESVQIPFSIQIPADAQPGDYTAGIVASMRVESDTGVVTERRLGSRVHLRVSGPLEPAISVSGIDVEYTGSLNPLGGGAATVSFTLTNSGNARLEPDVTVQIAGPFGVLPVSVRVEDVPELLPGSSIEQSVTVDGVAPLIWMNGDLTAGAHVVVRAGSTAGTAPSVDTASASASTWAVPWSTLLLLVVVAGLVVVFILLRRRAKRSRQRAVDAAVAAALSERDESVAATPVDAREPVSDTAASDSAAIDPAVSESAHPDVSPAESR